MKKVPVLLLLLSIGFAGISQTQRGLFIGINKYDPGDKAPATNTKRSNWPNLDGCVNDAQSMRDMVISRYGFKPENITELYDSTATRANIIAALKKLIAESQEGDIVFLFYAGHGSQVRNSKSKEKDQFDESIVPSDVAFGEKDIRDKELSGYLNQLLDKKITFTGIYDCCHSGSIGRGFINEPPKTRNMGAEEFDVADATDNPRPEGKGALLISAAQDFEFAKEQKDENGNSHGAFTLALLKALNSLGTNASVQDIFASVRAIMKYYGKTQEPVLAGSAERQKGTLFGLAKDKVPNKVFISVIKNTSGTVELQGGIATGINVGNKLKDAKGNELEVTEMSGANRSKAKVIAGSAAAINPGDLFEVTNWVSSSAPAITLYLPQTALDQTKLNAAKALFEKMKNAKAFTWITDIAKTRADVVFFYDKGAWKVSDRKKGLQVIGASIGEADIKKFATAKTSVFVNFPPETALHKAIKERYNDSTNVKVTKDVNDADYTLVGRMNDKGELEYGLVQPMVMESDSAIVLPKRTNFEPFDGTAASIKNITDSLEDYSYKIAKLKAWMTLTGPKGENNFPFVLEFVKYTSKEPIPNTVVKIKCKLTFNFAPDKENILDWDRKKRYIYVFSIDSKGAMSLMYPDPEGGSTENMLPAMDDKGNAAKSYIADILITPPAGSDHYFMLSTDEPIVNLTVFEQGGVLTRSAKGKSSGIEDLIGNTGTKTRGRIITRANWNIQKVILQTKEK